MNKLKLLWLYIKRKLGYGFKPWVPEVKQIKSNIHSNAEAVQPRVVFRIIFPKTTEPKVTLNIVEKTDKQYKRMIEFTLFIFLTLPAFLLFLTAWAPIINK